MSFKYTPKTRIGAGNSKESTPRSLVKQKSVDNFMNNAFSSQTASASKTPGPAASTSDLLKSKSKSSTALNSCYTPSSLFKGVAGSTKHASSSSTPKSLVKKFKTTFDVQSRTPDCFSKVSLGTPSKLARNMNADSTKLEDSVKSNPGEFSNLKVAVRVRPLSAKECINAVSNVIKVQENEITVIAGNTADNSAGVTHTFHYDNVFWSCNSEEPAYADQEKVFDGTIMHLIDNAFEGYNACLFAYGQTGSGKSYSMMGVDSDDVKATKPNTDAGIIPRFCHELFSRIKRLKGKISAEVEVSYFEIYNEKIHDLLAISNDGIINTAHNNMKKPPLKVREHPIWGPYVVDLSTHPVDSHSALRNWLAVGNSQRATAATGMNDKSSRSHSIFSVVLNLSEIEPTTIGSFNSKPKIQQTKRSKISLVDLAGSERVSHKTGDERNRDNIARNREGVSINKSLLTLGKVIAALADTKRTASTYVPYRDSVLTWLLRENLGGNSRTIMLATISPASIHMDETLATLRYACQARTIVNRVKVNEDPNDKIIRELKAEVERLQVLKQDYERQKRYSANAQASQTPRKIIIETSVDESEVESLRQQLIETEQELLKAQRSWTDRLQEAEDVRRTEMKLLKRKGLALELSAEQKEPCLVNLTVDPMLSGTLLYILPPGSVLIGRPSSFSQPDIILEGPLVSHHHCTIENRNNRLYLTPRETEQYETFVNGQLVLEKRQLFHGDRLVIGGSHYFRVSNPVCPNRSMQIMVDFQLAHQEVLKEQESRLRRELESEKEAAISKIEAERAADYEEKLASLELERFKYKCSKELLETEQEVIKNRQDFESSFQYTPYKSNLLDEIKKIMEHPSDENLHETQLMVKEATQRCRELGLNYEFKQFQVLDELGIFRSVVNIIDRDNYRIAEWVPARLDVWLSIVRDKDDLTTENIFAAVQIDWREDDGSNSNLFNDSLNSSRISLNMSSVKDAIFSRNSIGVRLSGRFSCIKQKTDMFKSMFKHPPPPIESNNIRKELLFTDTDENAPQNSQSPIKTNFEMEMKKYLKEIHNATHSIKRLCQKQTTEVGSNESSFIIDVEEKNNGTVARDLLNSVKDIDNIVQEMNFVLTEDALKSPPTGRTPKSVRFVLD